MNSVTYDRLSNRDRIRLGNDTKGVDYNVVDVSHGKAGRVIAVKVIIITDPRAWTIGSGRDFNEISNMEVGQIIYNKRTRMLWVVTTVHSWYAIAVRTIEVFPGEAGNWERV